MIPAESETADPTIRSTWLALPFQFFVGGAVLGIVTSVTFLSGAFSGGGDDYESLSLIGAPLVSSILAGIAMVLAFIVGLPLRLVRVLRHWWVTRGWVYAIAFAVVGLIGIPVAFYWPMSVEFPFDPSQPTIIAVIGPNLLLSLGFMVLAALGLCHLLRPMKKAASPPPASAQN